MILELINIEKSFSLPSGQNKLTVLDGVSLSVKEGEAIAVTGPSGSGKSTLLNIIGSLDKASSGSVMFNGRDLSAMNEKEEAEFRNKEIGFIFQLHHLLPQCTVLENVLIPTLAGKNNVSKDELLTRAKSLLEKVGLMDHLDYYPAQLSGGERQRTAVVRALINKPGLLLADEPTGSLDQQSADSLGRLLLQLNKEENVTLIVVTHSAALASKMDTVYTLNNGILT